MTRTAADRTGRTGRLAETVRVSAHLSCGCSQPKSPPVPMAEANTWPGTVVICDRHDEHAVVTRVSTYLSDSRGAVERLLRADRLDPDDAAAIAAEQHP